MIYLLEGNKLLFFFVVFLIRYGQEGGATDPKSEIPSSQVCGSGMFLLHQMTDCFQLKGEKLTLVLTTVLNAIAKRICILCIYIYILLFPSHL